MLEFNEVVIIKKMIDRKLLFILTRSLFFQVVFEKLKIAYSLKAQP